MILFVNILSAILIVCEFSRKLINFVKLANEKVKYRITIIVFYKFKLDKLCFNMVVLVSILGQTIVRSGPQPFFIISSPL